MSCIYLLRISRNRQLYPCQRHTAALAIISLQSENLERLMIAICPKVLDARCTHGCLPDSYGKISISRAVVYIFARESQPVGFKSEINEWHVRACVFSRISRFRYKLQGTRKFAIDSRYAIYRPRGRIYVELITCDFICGFYRVIRYSGHRFDRDYNHSLYCTPSV